LILLPKPDWERQLKAEMCEFKGQWLLTRNDLS
jgi:hypothetical protein